MASLLRRTMHPSSIPTSCLSLGYRNYTKYYSPTHCFHIRHFKGKLSFPLKAIAENVLYPIELGPGSNSNDKAFMTARNRILDEKSRIEEWHRKLGHIGSDRLFEMSRAKDEFPTFKRDALRDFECVLCLTAKTQRALELVHLDISGRIEASLEGLEYTVVFIDDFTA